jgi:hypothetical protein
MVGHGVRASLLPMCIGSRARLLLSLIELQEIGDYKGESWKMVLLKVIGICSFTYCRTGRNETASFSSG